MSCDKFSNMCKNNCDFTDPCNGSINCNNCGSMDPCDIGITCEVLNTEGRTPCKLKSCYIKAPKILATVSIGGTIIYHIDIPEGFSNVQTISRNISITNCTLIKKKLLVEGFIISNLTYSTPAPINSEDNCVAFRNNCNNITVKIPFTFSMTVDSDKLDDINDKLLPQSTEIYPFNCESTGSLVEQNSTLNNLPYCELEGCDIAELGCNKEISTCNMEMLDDYYNSCPPLYGRYTQKLSVTLYLSILVRSIIKLDCKKSPASNCKIDCNVPFKEIQKCKYQ